MSEQGNKTQEYIELLAHDPEIQKWILDYVFSEYDIPSEDFWDLAPLNLSDSLLIALWGLNSNQLKSLSESDSEEIFKDIDLNALYYQGYDIMALFFHHVESAVFNQINQITYH